jgi:hypothetical protein
MAGVPHQRLAALETHRLGDPARTLDVVDDLRAGIARQDVGGEQHQLAVGIDDLAVLGHHAEAVAVAIEGQAQFGVGLAQGAPQVFEVLRLGRIGVMVGEVAVDLAVQGRHRASHATE